MATKRYWQSGNGKPKANTPETTAASAAATPLLAPLEAPLIMNTSRDDLVKWRNARDVYEARVAERCAATNEDIDAVRTSIKNTIDRKVLKTCCEYRWDISVDDIDDKRIEEEFEKILGSVKNRGTLDLEKLFASRLKMDFSESDVEARVLNYFQLCDTIISENGIASILSTKEGKTEKCKLLTRSLAPQELRDAVEAHQTFYNPECRSDPVKLYKLVTQEALKLEAILEAIRERSKREREQQQHQSTKKRRGEYEPSYCSGPQFMKKQARHGRDQRDTLSL